jgi:response regulator NasT
MASAVTEVSTLKVVIVEDDSRLRQFLKNHLENELGHEVVGEAVNGTDMVRTVLAVEPDVILFDVNLPRFNGLDALKQIYQEMVIAAVVIINERERNQVRAVLRDYVLSYLVKPVEAQQIEPAVLVACARCEEFRLLKHENEVLRQNLQNRKVIERAKGVLMKRHRWTEAEGYRRLQRGAMNSRISMVQMAQAVLNGVEVEL